MGNRTPTTTTCYIMSKDFIKYLWKNPEFNLAHSLTPIQCVKINSPKPTIVELRIRNHIAVNLQFYDNFFKPELEVFWHRKSLFPYVSFVPFQRSL